jgi:serine/threonine-protein kinase
LQRACSGALKSTPFSVPQNFSEAFHFSSHPDEGKMNKEALRQILSTIYHHPVFRHAAIFSGICLGLLLLADWLIMPIYTKHGETVEVPNVTTMRVDDAKATLEAQDFEAVTGEERYSSQYPSGFVLEQSPRAAAKVKSGRRVYLVVSRGERRVQVPSLINLSERDAQLLLFREGLVLGEVNYEYSDSDLQPAGMIISQSIPFGAEVPQGRRVSVTVSAGSMPNEFVVPLVADGTRLFDEAAKMIRKAGLAVGSVRYEDVDDLVPETVIRQSLDAGTKVERGTKVDLVVSRLPSNVRPR